MSTYLPEAPDETIEEPDYSQPDQGDSSGEEEQRRKGRSQSDNLQDANRLRENLADKLSGKEAGGAGETAGEAAGQGAGTAGEGAGGAAGQGAGATAGASAGEGAGGAAGGAAGAGAAGAGASGAAAGTGATAAAGTAAGTAAGAAVGTGAGAGGGAAAGGAIGVAGGPLAPVTVPAGAVLVGGTAAAASNDKGRKALIFGLIGGCGCLTMLLFFPVFLIIGLFSSKGEAAGDPGQSGSTKLVIKKSATPTTIARGTQNAQVTYTITVQNTTQSEAIDVVVDDSFTTGADTIAFLALLQGVEGKYTIGTIAPGATNTKTFTLNIPNTDFDPGWILVNNVQAAGTIDGNVEVSNASVTVVIGKPINIPPSFSPLHNPDSAGGYVFGQTVINSRGQTSTHSGLDIHDNSSREVLSPFAQSAIVFLNTYDSGYGNYVILEAGEWQVYLTHLESRSSLRVGQVVDQNTFVGTMGCSGYCDGAHVHYEVRQNGTPVDPALYNALTPHP